MKNFNDYFSTIMGAAVAVANAWLTIDWEHFEWNKNTIAKLLLSGLVALGGYMTSLNTKSLNRKK